MKNYYDFLATEEQLSCSHKMKTGITAPGQPHEKTEEICKETLI